MSNQTDNTFLSGDIIDKDVDIDDDVNIDDDVDDDDGNDDDDAELM